MDYLNGLSGSIPDFVKDAIFGKNPARREATNGTTPVTRRVLAITWNPHLKTQGGKTLIEHLRWFDPAVLMKKYIADMLECSHGYVKYQLIEHKVLDEWPLKLDGFRYDENSFLKIWKEQKGFHDPDAFNYEALVRDHKLVDRVESKDVDEVWLWAMPFAGFWESHMAGPDAYFCNSPAMKFSGKGIRRFIMMGFNYQRDVDQALHSFGHRSESILQHVWGSRHGQNNLWERFIRHEHDAPGKAEVGTIHFAPNSSRDYQMDSKARVVCASDAWKTFPNLSNTTKQIDCTEWGCSEYGHMKWWLSLIPHASGESFTISNNWWEYLIDPDIIPG